LVFLNRLSHWLLSQLFLSRQIWHSPSTAAMAEVVVEEASTAAVAVGAGFMVVAGAGFMVVAGAASIAVVAGLAAVAAGATAEEVRDLSAEEVLTEAEGFAVDHRLEPAEVPTADSADRVA
jgi:hypothetical protein